MSKTNHFIIEEKCLIFKTDLLKSSVPQLYQVIFKENLSTITHIDLAQVSQIDSAGVAFLDELILFQEKNNQAVQIKNANETLASAIQIFNSRTLPESPKPAFEGIFEKTGSMLVSFWKEMIDMLYLTSDIVYWSIVGLYDKRGQRKGTLTQQGVLIGVDALPIVSLLSLIIGLIISLQSATQLKQFGANIFLANLIAISMVRELGPLITAIIVAGRSGSAIASEIATMKVSEEIDALKMMALNPIRFVVVPKFHAVTICMPLLVLFSILIGILGGMIIAITYLDLSLVSFVNTCLDVINLKDIVITMLKSIVFAWQIVIIGSHYGFQVTGGAEGVGKATTISVVISIFSVIMMDAVFSLFYLI